MLVHAVASGVGTAATQIAKQLGAVTIGTSRNAAKLTRAREYGLDRGIDTSAGPFRAALTEPVHVILDVLGGPAFADNLAVLAPRGRLVMLGFLQGAEAQANLDPILRKRLEVIGTVMRTRPLAERVPLVREFTERVLPLVLPAAEPPSRRAAALSGPSSAPPIPCPPWPKLIVPWNGMRPSGRWCLRGDDIVRRET